MAVTVEEIRSIIEEADTMADMDTLTNDIPLTEQEVDSLDMANIYLLTEEKLGVKILDKDIGKLKSVNDIVEYLNNK